MVLFPKLNLLFYIILFKSWNLTENVSIYSKDYDILDLGDKNNIDYWYNYETNQKRDANEPTNNQEYYPQNCKPVVYTTTTEIPTTTRATTSSTTCKSYTTETSITEAQDVIDHIMRILHSMREHAIALIKNMNELEMNILSTSPASNLEALCKNSTMAISESMNGMEKIIYPDVLSQKPNYSINGWSLPNKTDSIPESIQTNDFVAEAQEAVKSRKQQIEICKHILENAVRNALEKGNLKSDSMEQPIDKKDFKISQNSNDPLILRSNSNNYVHPSKENFKLSSKGLEKFITAFKEQQENVENRFLGDF